MIFVCHVTLQGPHDQSVIRLFGLEHLKVSDQHCKFSCHRHYDSRVMIFFFCHVISKGDAILWAEAPRGKSPP